VQQPPDGSDPAEQMVLTLSQAREGDRTVVSVIGEVDLATAPQLRDCLEAVLASRPAAVTVDMARLDFIDSVGLTVLIEAAHAAEQHQIGFALRSPQRATQKVLLFSGLADLLTIEDPADTGTD
jgi:anti-anti-sigma factor